MLAHFKALTHNFVCVCEHLCPCTFISIQPRTLARSPIPPVFPAPSCLPSPSAFQCQLLQHSGIKRGALQHEPRGRRGEGRMGLMQAPEEEERGEEGGREERAEGDDAGDAMAEGDVPQHVTCLPLQQQPFQQPIQQEQQSAALRSSPRLQQIRQRQQQQHHRQLSCRLQPELQIIVHTAALRFKFFLPMSACLGDFLGARCFFGFGCCLCFCTCFLAVSANGMLCAP